MLPSHERLTETEYHALLDPRFARLTRFGTFYSHPEFPDRYDANQLCRVRCARGQVDDMLQELYALCLAHRIGTPKVSSGSPDALAELGPELVARGWQMWVAALMLLSETPQRCGNSDLDVRSVPPTSPDLVTLYTSEGRLDGGFRLARSQFTRIGGEYLVGYVGETPVCCTGWFSVSGLIRFRHVFTAPHARGRGYATRLIRHVQEHPTVRSSEGLVIMVKDSGPRRLYEELGFREAATFWDGRRMGTETS
jgi:GNAT superfamily N-acetyltransferase